MSTGEMNLYDTLKTDKRRETITAHSSSPLPIMCEILIVYLQVTLVSDTATYKVLLASQSVADAEYSLLQTMGSFS